MSEPVYSAVGEQRSASRRSTASLAIALFGIFASALAAYWSFQPGHAFGAFHAGGYYLGPWTCASCGVLLALASLALKRRAIAWWAVGLSLYGIAWVLLSFYIGPDA